MRNTLCRQGIKIRLVYGRHTKSLSTSGAYLSITINWTFFLVQTTYELISNFFAFPLTAKRKKEKNSCKNKYNYYM